MSWLGGDAAHDDDVVVFGDGSDEGTDVVVVMWLTRLLLLGEVKNVGGKLF